MIRWGRSQRLFQLVDTKGPHDGDSYPGTSLFASSKQRTPLTAAVAQTSSHAADSDRYVAKGSKPTTDSKPCFRSSGCFISFSSSPLLRLYCRNVNRRVSQSVRSSISPHFADKIKAYRYYAWPPSYDRGRMSRSLRRSGGPRLWPSPAFAYQETTMDPS